jgi:hypothetical protein
MLYLVCICFHQYQYPFLHLFLEFLYPFSVWYKIIIKYDSVHFRSVFILIYAHQVLVQPAVAPCTSTMRSCFLYLHEARSRLGAAAVSTKMGFIWT